MFYTNSQTFTEIFSNVCPCNYLHLKLKIYTYLELFFLTLLVSQSLHFLHFINGVLWGEVPDDEVHQILVSSQWDSRAILSCLLLSSVIRFFLPGVCISLSHIREDKENFVQIRSVDSTICQEINLDFLEKFSKVLSFTRERGWHFQLLLCDKRSIASSSFCVWFNHVWVFRFVVYQSMWRFRFICFGNQGFRVSKRIHLVSFSRGRSSYFTTHNNCSRVQGFWDTPARVEWISGS